jgi:hypothetical protein
MLVRYYRILNKLSLKYKNSKNIGNNIILASL